MYGYIYKTTNLLNEKIYIGKKKGEFTEKYKGSGKYLKNAINKYGIENFKVEVIEYCKTLEEQNEREKYWIAYYRNQNIEMYNIANGGDGGDIFSCLPEEQLNIICKHLSEVKSGKNNWNYGTHLSKETRKKISIAHKGKILSEQTKQKLSIAHTGKKLSDGHKLKISQSESKENHYNWGKHLSLETRQKISTTNKGKPHPHKGRKLTELEKQKLVDSISGTIWVNNGIINKRISKKQLYCYLENNYILGRISWRNKEQCGKDMY